MRFHSLRTRLSLAYALFLLLVVGLGAFSIRQLDDYNRVTAEIRDRWLQSTRILGDLNNDTSDFRSAEGSFLLADTLSERQDSAREMDTLDASIAHSLVRYQRIHHDDQEDRLYQDFLVHWHGYHTLVRQKEQALPLESGTAIRLYRTDARTAYDRASEALGQLTQWNLVGAKNAVERESATYRDANGWIVAAILTAGLLLFTAIGFITRSVSNPLLDLAKSMQRIADKETEVPIQGVERSDEIGVMARSVWVFQDNAQALLTSQSRLAEQAKSLEDALAKAQEMTQQQHNFVLMTSHEFRTPLALIDGYAQRLYNARERFGPEEVGERALKIRRATQRLTTLLDNLLDVPKYSAEAIPFHPQQLDVKELLRRLCQEYREVAPDRTFQEHLGEHCFFLMGDAELLHQAFGNLLSNAVKYSAPGSFITLEAQDREGTLVIEISDQGIGIPERDRPHIFERYYRGSNVGSHSGTGVGLTLVNQIIALHRGTLDVASTEELGSRFTVHLPVLKLS
ncbi:MAG: HAMP domain-containing protein [Ferrovum sp.]|jgi:signal transduction histidine kinase|nr:HAMP domain-containing protein [Ferrovum sp.]